MLFCITVLVPSPATEELSTSPQFSTGSPEAQHGPLLSAERIAGVAVGGVAAVTLTIAVAILALWLQKRWRNRSQGALTTANDGFSLQSGYAAFPDSADKDYEEDNRHYEACKSPETANLTDHVTVTPNEAYGISPIENEYEYADCSRINRF